MADLQDHTRNTHARLFRYWSVVARLLWAGLFLIHLVPLTTLTAKLLASPSLYLVLALAAILGIMTLALLKALDVRCLRFSLTVRQCCTIVFLGLFFHGDVVARNLPDIVIAESTLLVFVALVAANRKLRHFLVKLVACTGMQLREALYALVEALAPAPLVPALVLQTSPRPPPARR